MQHKSVAIVGAGWAGCAAAVALARCGISVTLFEAARVAGGRARRVEIDGLSLDNGQHILLGAYRDTLKLMRQVGLQPEALLLRLPLQMRYGRGDDGMDLIAARLPAPLHLMLGVLRARGLSVEDKPALARFASAARWMGWQLDVDCSVIELLARFEQTERVYQLMWRPLCIAALNTAPEQASAKVFLAVLRDSLGANRAASDMLLPRVDLSALLPDAAIAWLQKNGQSVAMGSRVQQLQQVGRTWYVVTDHTTQAFDAVIVATSAPHAHALLSPLDTGLTTTLTFEHAPITTCYLQYASSVRLPAPMLALRDNPKNNAWGQYVFDRGQLNSSQAGLFAVVISDSGAAASLSQDALEGHVVTQLSNALQMPELLVPRWRKTITEKRATFVCSPDLKRPSNATPHAGLWLAGDYTASEYPATIESAVRSGLKAASACFN